MGGNIICSGLFNNFQLLDLQQKNNYNFSLPSIQPNSQLLDQNLKIVFGNNLYLKERYINLLTFLTLNPNQLFEDNNFKLEGKHASTLYHYERRHMCLIDDKNRLGSEVFQQNHVQLTYLSVVGYFLSNHKQLLSNRILVSEKLNKNQTYVFRFFCNGQDEYVVVDDKIPTNSKDEILYTKPKGKQIWPLLLEKAWFKMIGNQKKALGLSPVQCLQQITGVPAKAYRISQNQIDSVIEQFHQVQNSSNWLCVIARRGIKSIQEGQVFVIDEIQGDVIYLMSPFYSNSNNSNNQSEQRRVRFTFQSLLQSFQYMIVGYYKKGYEPYSYPMKSQKGAEKLYELNIKKGEEISIRFVQYYKQYLDSNQQNQSHGYQYSPLAIFQLYDHNGNIMKFCQGCENLHVGIHSAYVTSHINHLLETGKYFIRIQVDWVKEQILKQGKLVVYASKGNVQIKQLDFFDQRQKIYKLNLSSLNLPNAVIISSERQPFKVNYLKKKLNILFSIQNLYEENLALELDFHGSYNFKIKETQIQKDNKIILKLGAQQLRIFEIMPDQLRPASNIQMCTIRRLANQN